MCNDDSHAAAPRTCPRNLEILHVQCAWRLNRPSLPGDGDMLTTVRRVDTFDYCCELSRKIVALNSE
jgi:hypothetical protein